MGSIADKKKFPGKVFWEVKQELLLRLGLHELLNKIQDEDLANIASFVHLNELNSRDKLVEELLMKFSNVFPSRAHAHRTIISIADMKKFPGKIFWEVKQELLLRLGLHELLNKAVPKPIASSNLVEKKTESPKTKKNTNDKKKRLLVSKASAELFAQF